VKSKDVAKVISDWQRHIAKLGGQSRSAKKRETARANAAKARKARAEKRRKGLGK